MTRRGALAGLLYSAGTLRAQVTNKTNPGKPKLPSLCISATALAGVGYAEIGDIVKQLGFDGVDITVMPGGLVEPQLAPVDEVRAFESIHGAGLDSPIITTALMTPYEPWCRTVLALAGRTGVSLATLGFNRANYSIQTKRDLFALTSIGREYKIGVTINAGAGQSAFDIAHAETLLSGIDTQWAGINLHSDVSEIPNRDILAQVKAVSLADSDGKEPRPLGKGTTDFGKLFGALATAGFAGPITVYRKYKTADGPGAIGRDCEFARKQIQLAYASPKT